jgi:hypothetical protein
MDLDDVAFRDGEVMHALGHQDVGPCGHVPTRMLIELVTDSHAPDSRKYGDVFIDRVLMGWKLRARG